MQRCNRIVADLLSFARRHTPERALMDVTELLTATLAMRDRHLQAKGVWPRLCVDLGLPKVVADAHQLQQVVLNIIINAEHALRESGKTLRINAERVTRPAGPPAGEWLAIRIDTDGPPIPREARAKIFEPFFTTKAKDEGTGLGLAICLRIVRDHGGTIDVESGDDGTTFTILLPVPAETVGEEAEGEAEGSPGQRLAS
ncbi:MAG TPA: ATP-binding protein [Longimicrobiaceae bacterium]|nr:ATP-binding protein [Longimicrobiaceae bacterium]